MKCLEKFKVIIFRHPVHFKKMLLLQSAIKKLQTPFFFLSLSYSFFHSFLFSLFAFNFVKSQPKNRIFQKYKMCYGNLYSTCVLYNNNTNNCVLVLNYLAHITASVIISFKVVIVFWSQKRLGFWCFSYDH